MMILGVDLNKIAAPATVSILDSPHSTILRMMYHDKMYTHSLSHFELIKINSNEALLSYIINIINEGKQVLGATSD